MGFLHSHMGRGRDPEPQSSIPVEMPAHCRTPDTLQDIIARLLWEEKAKDAMANSRDEVESPEEADDFELPDEDFMLDMSPYEIPETHPEALQGYEVTETPPPIDEGPKGPENSSEGVTDQGESSTPPDS